MKVKRVLMPLILLIAFALVLFAFSKTVQKSPSSSTVTLGFSIDGQIAADVEVKCSQGVKFSTTKFDICNLRKTGFADLKSALAKESYLADELSAEFGSSGWGSYCSDSLSPLAEGVACEQSSAPSCGGTCPQGQLCGGTTNTITSCVCPTEAYSDTDEYEIKKIGDGCPSNGACPVDQQCAQIYKKTVSTNPQTGVIRRCKVSFAAAYCTKKETTQAGCKCSPIDPTIAGASTFNS